MKVKSGVQSKEIFSIYINDAFGVTLLMSMFAFAALFIVDLFEVQDFMMALSYSSALFSVTSIVLMFTIIQAKFTISFFGVKPTLIIATFLTTVPCYFLSSIGLSINYLGPSTSRMEKPADNPAVNDSLVATNQGTFLEFQMLWLLLGIFVYCVLSSSLATTYVRFSSLKQMKYRTFLISSLMGLWILCILIYLYEFDV